MNPKSTEAAAVAASPLRTMKRAVFGLIISGGLILGFSAFIATTYADTPTPSSCSSFVSEYFDSNLPDGALARFTLASHATRIGSSLGPVGYAEGSVALTNQHWQGQIIVAPRLSADSLDEYFSDRRYSDGVASDPFNPAATDKLGVSISRSMFGSLGITLKLVPSGTQLSVTPVGCLNDNLVYGTTSSGDSIVSIALGSLSYNPPPK